MSSTALFRPETKIARADTAEAGQCCVGTSLGTISVRVTDDIPSLKGLWETMQAAVPCTEAQTYEWGRAWAEHVLVPRGDKPVIVVGYKPEGTPIFL